MYMHLAYILITSHIKNMFSKLYIFKKLWEKIRNILKQ